MKVYAECESYADTGTIKSTLTLNQRFMRNLDMDQRFYTNFKRPDQLRFAHQTQYPFSRDWDWSVVWARGDDVKTSGFDLMGGHIISLGRLSREILGNGVVRWRRVDLKSVIAERFGVVYCERGISRLLDELGFAHISARPNGLATRRQTVGAPINSLSNAPWHRAWLRPCAVNGEYRYPG